MTWKTRDIWHPEPNYVRHRTQLYKTHNTGKTGMNGIPGDIVTSKAVHFTVTGVMSPFFYFASTNSTILS